jgi:hypothetical protein
MLSTRVLHHHDILLLNYCVYFLAQFYIVFLCDCELVLVDLNYAFQRFLLRFFLSDLDDFLNPVICFVSK